MEAKNDIMQFYTDGACSGNPGPGGWAWLRVSNGEIHAQNSGYEEQTTNNRMELLAVINALENFHKNSKQGSCALEVYTDSSYVQQGITKWIKNWKKNGWRTASRQPVKNQDLWQKLDALQEVAIVSWHWLKGHSENKFNNICDELAVQAYKERRKI